MRGVPPNMLSKGNLRSLGRRTQKERKAPTRQRIGAFLAFARSDNIGDLAAHQERGDGSPEGQNRHGQGHDGQDEDSPSKQLA